MSPNPARGEPVGLALDVEFRDPRQQFLKGDASLESCQGRSQTGMNSVPESEVAGDLALDVEALGILELALVQVGCCEHQQHPSVCGNGSSVARIEN